MRIGGYGRLSDEGGDSLERQEEDIRALTARRGWELAEPLYIDPATSAYKKRRRPEFERMLEDLESGAIDGVAVYDIDRLARQPRDMERLIDLIEAKPSRGFATCQGDIDLSTSDGRFMARILVNVANKSSADTSRRVARMHLSLAQQGKFGGGGSRPFGYEPDRVTVRASEAAVIRDAAERVLAGESLTSICRSLDEAGVPTPKKSPKWDRGVLKRALTGPRTAGYRTYQRGLLMGEDGSPVKGLWPAILDVATWEAVRVVLMDENRNPGAGRVDRRYLLSGFLRCKCGAKCYGVIKHGTANYQCPIDRGCGNTCRRAEALEDHITELVLRYLEQQEVQANPQPEVAGDAGNDVAIKEAERSLANLIIEWDANRMSDAVFFAAQARKEATLNALKKSRAVTRRKLTLVAPIGKGARPTWAAANLSQRRAILAEVLVAIKVLPKPANAPKRFLPEYYLPIWTDEQQQTVVSA